MRWSIIFTCEVLRYSSHSVLFKAIHLESSKDRKKKSAHLRTHDPTIGDGRCHVRGVLCHLEKYMRVEKLISLSLCIEKALNRRPAVAAVVATVKFRY